MKKILLTLLIVICCFVIVKSQETEVDVKGVGVKREDALQDAFRNAIGKAVGVSLVSESKVENFVLIQDAITTKTKGYISSYEIKKETPLADRYEIDIHARVSLAPLKADIQLLANSIGGVRFLVMYDARNLGQEDIDNLDFATERINEYLATKKYRYIEKSRFNELKKEAQNIMHESEPTQDTYVQCIGLMANAQFIIFISKVSSSKRSEAFDTRSSSKAVIEVKVYDNCTAEGLGTVTLESNWKSVSSGGVKDAIKEAVTKDFDKLMGTFNSYIGEWVNNGTPFELRFYSSGTFRDMRELREKLKSDSNFGGQMEIVSFDNYTKLNCTFKKKPDELADKVLDYADQVPSFKSRLMDVKYIYGRQISFAPQSVKLPDSDIIPKNNDSGGKSQGNKDNVTPADTIKKMPAKTKPKTPAKTTKTAVPKSTKLKQTTKTKK